MRKHGYELKFIKFTCHKTTISTVIVDKLEQNTLIRSSRELTRAHVSSRDCDSLGETTVFKIFFYFEKNKKIYRKSKYVIPNQISWRIRICFQNEKIFTMSGVLN